MMRQTQATVRITATVNRTLPIKAGTAAAFVK